MPSALPILIATISVVLAIVASHMSLRREIAELQRSIGGLRERLARLDGLVDALLESAARRGAERQPGSVTATLITSDAAGRAVRQSRRAAVRCGP